MTTLEILREARALIERGWTQKVYARDINGDVCAPTSPKAAKLSLLGAVKHAYDSDWIPEGCTELLWDAVESMCGARYSPIEFNDNPHRTAADVLRLLDSIISKLQEPGQENAYDF